MYVGFSVSCIAVKILCKREVMKEGMISTVDVEMGKDTHIILKVLFNFPIPSGKLILIMSRRLFLPYIVFLQYFAHIFQRFYLFVCPIHKLIILSYIYIYASFH